MKGNDPFVFQYTKDNMRRLLATVFVGMLTIGAFAQGTSQAVTQKSDLTMDQIIEKYGSYEEAIYEMDRSEWDVFRASDIYNEEEVSQLIWDNKNTPEKIATRQSRKAKRMMPPGDGCNCWIEPDDTYTQIATSMWDETGGAGPDVDAWLGPISLGAGVTFNHYGTTYNSFYINSKGTISFGGGYIDWTPEGFPEATYNQIAGFWADVDIREQGEIYYKVTPEAVYVNFVDVDYFNATSGSHFARSNTFQMIITPEGSDFLGDNNVQLCYLDMGWAHGDVGGNGGFNGPNPGVNGADAASGGDPGIQFGRFNINNSQYDGPGGAIDGINWLDNKQFDFSVASASSNIPPIASFDAGCDTITVCLSDTLDLGMSFLSPESGQITTITANEDVTGFEILSVDNNNTAVLDAIFVGSPDNLGFSTITITATDDGEPAGVTELNIFVEVIDVELPAITVSGDFAVCPFEGSLLEANSGFEEYFWSNGCDTQDCEHTIDGEYYVEGFIQGCVSRRDFDFEVEGLQLLPVTIESPICEGDSALAFVDTPEDYVSIEWTGNYNDLGGEVLSTNGFDEAYLTVGTFQALGFTESGCPHQRVFNITSANALNIPEDIWSGAYCDGLEDLVFDGADGGALCNTVTIVMVTGDSDGWGDSFLDVNINGTSEIYLSDGPSTTISLNLCTGDEMSVQFVSDGEDEDNKEIYITSNACLEQTINNITDLVGLGGQVIFEESIDCDFVAPLGDWDICGGPGGSFSIQDEFNTTFTPDDYGLYDLCFVSASCGDTTNYSIEFNEFPELTLTDEEVTLCPGESFTAQVANSYDPGNTGVLTFPQGGPDYGPYNGYEFLDLDVTLENGCGTATAELVVQSLINPQPDVEDAVVCDGTTVTLVAMDNPTPDLIYEWTLDGFIQDEEGNEFEVDGNGSGLYVVTVSNECFPGGNSDEAEVLVGAVPQGTVLNAQTIDCQGDGNASVCPELSPSFNILWPDGTTGIGGDCFETSSEGPLQITVTDNGNCFEETYSTEVVITGEVSINPTPTSALVLCPEVVNVLDVNSQNSTNVVWSVVCPDNDPPLIVLSETGDALSLTSNMIPQDCWESAVIQATALGLCGSAEAEYLVVVDPCDVTIPNIFTPNNDNVNDTFVIEGLEVYNGVKVVIRNRWGQVVFESDDYQNDGDSSVNWKGEDESEGTYFYEVILPNGVRNGIVTIAR
ncbi:MAG: gliding motility-associated C-terminal domain-containing protein [Flavobacteriales bacterium]|nr:gliding motility-associated C-terminal domain-containing protein [Flavobacteriales bacterium]